jgi:hypothetical protein
MNKVFLLSVVLLLIGCAQPPRMPVDVSVIPDDCANRQAIISWLERVNDTPKALLETQGEYDQKRSEIKARIWRIRYNCQRI